MFLTDISKGNMISLGELCDSGKYYGLGVCRSPPIYHFNVSDMVQADLEKPGNQGR